MPVPRILCVLVALLVPAMSFQNRHHMISASSATRYRGIAGSNFVNAFSQMKTYNAIKSKDNSATVALLSNGSDNTNGNNDYNDDAFGFVLLIGYLVTQDAIFAGTFLVLSALAATATRSGSLPATSVVPSAVAGSTFVIDSILPSDKLYGLLPFIERTEPSLPIESSWIKLGICSISVFYGIIRSYSSEKQS